MSIQKRSGLWRNWVGAALARAGRSGGERSRKRLAESRALAIEALESRALLAVTFQLNFVADGSIGFNDATNGAARKAAAQTVATRVGSWFNHTATVQVDMRNDNNAGDNYLAEVTTPPPSQSGDGFFHTVMGQKIVTNGATDPNGATVDTTMTFNWANSFELADTFTAGEYDFQATMAHELMHAVGFTANLNFNGSSAYGGGAKNWSKFDQFITNAAGAPVINQTTFVTDQAVWQPIRTAGTNKVFFGGPQTKAVTGGAGLKLYAPGSFDIASSISHSDDDAPEIASQTHNMTAAQDFGRNARGFHISEIGVMKDLGFSMIDTTAQIVVTPTGGNTTVLERNVFIGDVDTDTFDVKLSDKPLTDVVIDVRSMANGEMKVDKTRLTFTPSNWNTPQTVTVTGVTDGVVSESPTVPVRLSVIDSLSDANYDPVADVDVPVKVDQETTQAPTFVVNSTADIANPTIDPNDGTNTLREGILFANQQSGASIGANTQVRFSSAVFNTARTITLTQGELVVTGSLELLGPGVDLLTISGNNASRILRATGGNNGVRITDLTITGGAAGGANEGAVRNENTGVMMLIGVAMSGNGQTAVFNAGRYVGIYNSALTGNNGVSGGAAFNSNGLMDIVNTTISGNTASANAGGVWNLDTTNNGTTRLTIINSSIISNRLTSTASNALGGGIGEFNSGAGRTSNNTVLINTIVKGNQKGPVGGSSTVDYFSSNGIDAAGQSMNVEKSFNNIIGGNAPGGLVNGQNGNIVNGVGVGTVVNTTLALNGGKTQNHALPTGSPAIDAGLNSIRLVAFDGEALGSDQRNSGRLSGPTIDMGSFELVVNLPPTLADIAPVDLVMSTASNAVPLTVGDPDTPLANLTLAAVFSDNSALVPVGNLVFGGSGANRTVTITPVAGQTGTANVVIRVSDGVNTVDKNLQVRVSGIQPPTLADIPDVLIAVSTNSGAIPLTVGDPDTPLGSLVLSAIFSDNSALVPAGNIVFGGSGANRTMTITPVAGQTGTVNVAIRVSDGTSNVDKNVLIRVRGLDFGDAPDTYKTLLASDGPRHLGFGATLGPNADTEANGFPGPNADGDDTAGSPDDEDGVTFGTLRAGQQNASVTINVGSALPGGAFIDAWIDFNGDGTFNGVDEQIFKKKLVQNGANNLTFVIPAEARLGDTFARVRISDNGGLTPRGYAPDGEVEDYKVTVSRPLKGDKNFNQRQVEASGAYSVRAADLDGDGDVDFISALYGDGDVVWYENNGSQQFTKRTIDANFPSIRAVLAVDLDGDGDLDVAAAGNNPSNKLVWYRNNGNRTFSGVQNIDTNALGATSVTAADMDGDGDQDLLTSAYADNRHAWYENVGGGNFTQRILSSTANGAGDLIPVDLDKDGDMDAVGVARFTGNMTFYRNNGAQVFTAVNVATGLDGPEAVQAIDLDKDGDLDLVATEIGGFVLPPNSPGNVSWFENNGSQTFTRRPLTSLPTQLFGTFSVAAGDIDGDGDIDIAASVYGQGAGFFWFENGGTQNFTLRPVLASNSAQFITLADVNKDGRLDFVTASFLNNTVSWVEQGAAPENAAPVLDASGNPYYIAGVGQRTAADMTTGILVSDLLARGAGGTTFSDADAGALRGIAVTAIDKTFGKWQFTTTPNPTDANWTDIDAAGGVSGTSALLLAADANTRIRMVSTLKPHHEGTVAQGFIPLESKLAAGITFRAWDQTSGAAGQRADTSSNGGSTAFSTATEGLATFFEARLWRSFNTNAGLNIYTLEAEFFALTGNPAIADRSTTGFTGFTIFLSALTGTPLATAGLTRMYYGVQFNTEQGTETDMGYRYLTTNQAEAAALENLGPAAKRPLRQGAYFSELGVNAGSAIIGYIYTAQQPGTLQMTQVYRTDNVGKPTRPGGTAEGSTPTSTRQQEQGDHVYTTNTGFETGRPGTWRIEAARGFVRELTPAPTGVGPAISAPAVVAVAAMAEESVVLPPLAADVPSVSDGVVRFDTGSLAGLVMGGTSTTPIPAATSTDDDDAEVASTPVIEPDDTAAVDALFANLGDLLSLGLDG